MYSHNRYANGDAISDATRMDPTQPITSTDPRYANYHGYFEWTDGGSSLNDPNYPTMWNRNTAANPIARLYEKNDRANSYDYMGNVEVDYQIHGFEDLRLHANASGDWANGQQDTDYANWGPSNFYYGNSGYTFEKKYNLTFSAYAATTNIGVILITQVSILQQTQEQTRRQASHSLAHSISQVSVSGSRRAISSASSAV